MPFFETSQNPNGIVVHILEPITCVEDLVCQKESEGRGLGRDSVAQ